jgi:hypothetical protein
MEISQKKLRILTMAIIGSSILNVALLGSFFYESVRQRDALSSSKSLLKSNSVSGQVVASMEGLTFRELVSFLTNKEMVGEGLTKRDLGLAALVAFHHFHLEKALSTSDIPKKLLPISKERQVEVFPALNDEQYEAIIRFAYREKWPLTPKGLFACLQNLKDASLEQAFAVTPEFYCVQIFFQKSGAKQELSSLLNLVREGSWELLTQFSSEAMYATPEKRREVLQKYMGAHSKTAAEILLRTDFGFALNQIDDKKMLDLLGLLSVKSEEAVSFCIQILASNRSEGVLQAAASRLYAYAGDTPSLPIDPKDALARYSPGQVKRAPAQVAQKAASRLHVVKDGENLWKIARQYKVKVDEIVKLNEMEKDALYPGMTLMIP